MIYHATFGDGEVLSNFSPDVTTVYMLVLNPMRGRTEEQRALAASTSRDELLAFWHGERVEPYQDENWRKCYRKGGPLEWFNPPWSDGDVDDYGNGIIELCRDGWRRSA